MSEDTTEGWFDAESATLGDRITGARDAAGMNQKELSKRIGIKLTTLQDWENDLSEPRANKLQMLAGLLNVSITWLLEGVGDGVDGPDEGPPIDEDMRSILSELRELKARANKTANRLGALEKRLAGFLKEHGIG
ncbi:helix-turn-helix domain-containing protein [Rhodobacteraceae bacterium LMO-12]|nr:helix-turn-helix domain-containing protein [Rhodobacteraceae bacterium LMO-JJ12]